MLAGAIGLIAGILIWYGNAKTINIVELKIAAASLVTVGVLLLLGF